MNRKNITKMSQPVIICDKCNVTFTRKRNMLRHYKMKHTKETVLRPYECEICKFKFTRKDILRKHLQRKHVERIKETFICAECSAEFDDKSSIRKHIYITHIPKTKEALNCPHCEKPFSTYRTLKRHVGTIHFQNDHLECAHCMEKFARRDNLARHIRLKHQFNDDGSSEEYICTQCNVIFTQKHFLRDHIRYRHYVAKEEKSKSKTINLRCLECQQSFTRKRTLNYHYEQEHGITFSFENLHFASFKRFEDWRERMQSRTVTQFVLQNSWKTENFVTKQYACHRAGTYYDKRQTRLRRLKTTGYKKLGGHCPAEIFLKSLFSNGQCIVTFQQTHVGHAVNDKAELDRNIFFTDDQQLQIAAMIENGATVDEILEKQCHINPSEQDASRLRVLSRSDLHNLISRPTIGSRRSKASVDDLDLLVEQSRNAILYLKDQSHEDTIFQTLDRDDFVMVLMSRTQEKYLRQYGSKMIVFDGIEETSRFNFYIHTMLIVDVNCEAIPVAFMVSNRSDRDVVDIFVKKVRDNVEIVKTKVILTDMSDIYHNSWLCSMNKPEYYFYSSWHVSNAWDKELRKIRNRKKKNDLCEKLYNLAHELDQVLFEEKLESFLSTQNDNHAFMSFFRQHFSKNPARWAHCYRNIAGINTNMHYDTFLKMFRHSVTTFKKKSLEEILSYVLKYLVTEEQNEGIIQLDTIIPQRIAALKRRHKSPERHFQQKLLMVVQEQEEQTWQVGFIQDTDDMVQEMYIVTKIEPKECSLYGNSICQLFCTSCVLCFHEYRCSCPDSVIFNNMCEHIHALGIYQKNLKGTTFKTLEDGAQMDDKMPYVEYEEDTIVLNDVDVVPQEENEDGIDVKIIEIDEIEKIHDEGEKIDVEEVFVIDDWKEIEEPTTAIERNVKGTVIKLPQRLMRRNENVLLMA